MTLIALVVLAIAAGGTRLMTGLRRLLPTDVPGDRSSHARPTRRGGGLAPAVAVAAGLVLSDHLVGRPRLGVLAATLSFGALGLAEDFRGVPLVARFGCQLAAAALALAGLLGGLTGPPAWRVAFAVGALLWIVSFVNAFNFMDGIDGIAAAQAVVAGGAWYLLGRAEAAPGLAAGGLMVAAGGLGFLPFNLPRARVFLGDVGSYALGAALAALLVVGLRAGITPEAMLAPLALYLADTGYTLARRVARGDVWYEPHREHAYQRLVVLGWSHPRTTATAAAWMAVCSAVGWLAVDGSVGVRLAAGSLIVALAAAWLALPAVVERRRRRREGATGTPLPSAPSAKAAP